MMSLNELDDLVNHVGTRNLAKCVECGATPYRVVGDGKAVEVYDALDESWSLLEAFPTKAARERWERAEATRDSHVPYNGLARLGSKPWSARVVRLEQDRSMKHSGMITVKETPSWRHVSSIQMADAAAAIRAMADDDATIIDTDGESLRRLLEPATLCGSSKPQIAQMNADPNPDANEDTMKQKQEHATPNAQRSTPNAGSVAMIAIDELTEHPDALAFWPDSRNRHEDIETICDSIVDAGGVGEPLTVCRRADGGWWVIDGCTRLKGARRAALNAVPCLAVDIRDDKIKDEVFMRNMTRTRFGTGMRIMRYLEKHHDQVLAAAIVNADPAKSGALGGRGKKAESRDTGFSSGAIAERLKVSDKDVRAAIELLRCRAEGRIVDAADGTRTLRTATDEEREGVEEAYRRVLDGTPPRRWLPAARGHAATNDKVKAETRWHEVARRAFVSVQNAFAHLGEMDSGLRAKVIAEWADTAKVVGKHIGNMGAQP